MATRPAKTRKAPKPPHRYEEIKFVAPRGTRDFYRQVAAQLGARYEVWIRETLHKEGLRLLQRNRVECDAPDVHPVPPPPLQPDAR